MNRQDSLRLIRETPEWDVLVIGGGATGLGTALDAATRGYRTVLVEQSDFAKATSSRSTKLVHGGVRYLREGDLGLVKGALLERSRLLANAPDLVRPLSFVIPCHSLAERLYYAAGLKLYDLLAGRRGLGASRLLGRDGLLAHAPGLDSVGASGGVLYFDAQFDDARLAIALAQTFAEHGGAPLNYARVTGLRKRDGRVCGAVVRDEESGEEFEIAAKCVVNATGVFCDRVREFDRPGEPSLVSPSQGAHLVLPGSFLPGDTAILIPETADGRVLFAIPWHGRVLLGTTDVPVERAELDPHPLAQEIEFLKDHAKRFLGWTISGSEILSAFAGLRPLIRAGGNQNTARLSRDHSLIVSDSGLVSIAGGKWTTYRRMAEDAVNSAARVGGLPVRACRTEDLRITASTSDTDLSERDREPIHPRLPYCWGDIRRAIRSEMARTVEDVLSRRTRSLILDARASFEITPTIAHWMGAELGQSEGWVQAQTESFQRVCAAALSMV